MPAWKPSVAAETKLCCSSLIPTLSPFFGDAHLDRREGVSLDEKLDTHIAPDSGSLRGRSEQTGSEPRCILFLLTK